MSKVTYKLVYNFDKSFSHVELIQGDNVIKLSFSGSMGEKVSGRRWQEVRKYLDELQSKVHEEAKASINTSLYTDVVGEPEEADDD